MTKDGSDPVSVSWKEGVKIGLPVEDHEHMIVDNLVVDDGMPNSVLQLVPPSSEELQELRVAYGPKGRRLQNLDSTLYIQK